MVEIVGFCLLGAVAGLISGLLGIGGAVFMVPALIFVFGFEQKMAQGTTLLLMVPPIGLLAAMEYYKMGYANIKAGALIALFFFVGGLFGGKLAVKLDAHILRKVFALFLFGISIRLFFK